MTQGLLVGPWADRTAQNATTNACPQSGGDVHDDEGVDDPELEEPRDELVEREPEELVELEESGEPFEAPLLLPPESLVGGLDSLGPFDPEPESDSLVVLVSLPDDPLRLSVR